MTLDLKELRRVAGEASGSRPDAPPVSLYRRVAAFSRAANPATVIALLDEIRRLTRAVQYEQHRAERIGTHGPGCWKWGPQHYECAVEEVERLRDAEGRASDMENHANAMHSVLFEMFRVGTVDVAFAGNPAAIESLKDRTFDAMEAFEDQIQREHEGGEDVWPS